MSEIDEGDLLTRQVNREVKKLSTLEFAYSQMVLNYRKMKRAARVPEMALIKYRRKIKHMREIIDQDLICLK